MEFYLPKKRIHWSYGIFLRTVVNSQKLSFPSSSQRKGGLRKYIGDIKAASRLERGLGSNHSTGTLSPSLPPLAQASLSGQLLPGGAPESQAPASPLPEGRGIFSFKRAEVSELSLLGLVCSGLDHTLWLAGGKTHFDPLQ